ncbi:phosphopantetheine-binding protein [Ruminococcus sp.]|uniref:acyl carrier protein n=1 Tax=Ruminococcus sp. TaxID=41978 RepID=UPI002C9EA787|nr:phosphopantetheine-binding protein [Ruminococcus sp.]HNZ99587.1 phosphopantetheine-binding protein [Ruminococcus sp.]HOH86349.1 phosphopantetheine-binding protein [Ruminococcus sp.]
MKADREHIREIVAEALEIEASQIGDGDNFVTDLTMNSLQMLDCVADIEDDLDIRIPKEAIKELTCVDKVVEYIEGYNE